MKKDTSIQIPLEILDLKSLSITENQLIYEAQQACDKSYSPYSNFQVGVAIALENGEVVQGANQENASFPAGLCAERVALAVCQAQYTGIKITKMAVMARRAGTETYLPISPCGICRQSLLEVEVQQQHNIEILLPQSQEHFYKIDKVAYLLPFQFDKSHL
jgi:cytidine deaminase